MKNLQAFIIGLFTILLFGTVAATANAATWTVTKSTNSNDNVCDTDCSLREAVFNADSGDIVVFDPNIIGQTITLGGSEIVITRRIIIDGFLNDPNVAFISGSNTSRIFVVETGGGLDLRNATLVLGNGMSATYVNGVGGAIYAFDTASISLNRVAFRGNSAVKSGAIELNSGTHSFINSSFTSSSAETCLAVSNEGANANLYMANVTVSGSFDSGGLNGLGAVCNNGGNLFIRNSTIVKNMSDGSGGGIWNGALGDLNLGNTIVAQNTATNSAPDIRFVNGSIVSVGGNLIGDLDTVPANTFNKPNDIFGINPLLAPTNSLQGGHPVTTHPLQAGSPARNGGLNANAVDPLTNLPLTNDARGAGFPRIADTTVDIGAFEDQSGGTSLIVSKLTNSNDLVCDTDCSLREAVHQASLNFGTDTITFAANVFGTLALGGTEILIQNHNVNIVGYPTLTAETLIASGADTNRIFHLNNATVNITGMTLANGDAGAGFGGAILSENNSNLTLNKIIVRNNFATAYGAIYVSGGTGHFTDTTINNNSANTGLAIGNSGTLNMANTTVSANLDADGGTGIGAIYNTGTLNVRNSTISFNRTTGGTGGGIFNDGTLNVGNSIVSNNIALIAPDINQNAGTITSVGGNLISNSNGFPMGTFAQTNDAVDVDPMLAALTDNGGNVTTHSLMPNSPAINTGINANAVDPFDNAVLAFDARGNFSRIVSGTVDKGAFESLAPTAASVTIGGQVLVGKGGLTNAKVYLTDQQGNVRAAKTSSFGYYHFDDVEVGQTYILTVVSKRFHFDPQVVSVNEEINNLNFISQ